MDKELKKIANKLIKKGKKVFINNKKELFTQENLAKASKSPYREYTNTSIKNSEIPLKNYNLDNEALIELIKERGLNVGDAKVKKEFIAILKEDDQKNENKE